MADARKGRPWVESDIERDCFCGDRTPRKPANPSQRGCGGTEGGAQEAHLQLREATHLRDTLGTGPTDPKRACRLRGLLKVGTLLLWSPTFLAPGTSFMEDNSSMDQGWGGGWFRDDSSALHLLCTLFLLLLHGNI